MSNITNLKSILLIAANPQGTPSLRLQEEERVIKDRLRQAGYGRTPIASIGATQSRDILQAMTDLKPQIVHFSGHGAGKDGLVVEDASGQEKLISSKGLASLFKQFSEKNLECVILNACDTSSQAEEIVKDVNYVIATTTYIEDRMAIEFAVGFYTGLGAGESIEFAFELGCNAIRLEFDNPQITHKLYKKTHIPGIKLEPDGNFPEEPIQLETKILRFVHQSIQNGVHPVRSQEIKIALEDISEYEVEVAIQNLLIKREMIEERGGVFSVSSLGRSSLKKKDNISPREMAFALLKKMSNAKFQEIVFKYKISRSYLSINSSQLQQAIEVVDYANEKEGENLEDLIKIITEVISI